MATASWTSLSGENWYQAPKWTRHQFREIAFAENYIDDFSDLPLDVNGDGKMDMISVSWFAKKIVWFENPGALGKPLDGTSDRERISSRVRVPCRSGQRR